MQALVQRITALGCYTLYDEKNPYKNIFLAYVTLHIKMGMFTVLSLSFVSKVY